MNRNFSEESVDGSIDDPEPFIVPIQSRQRFTVRERQILEQAYQDNDHPSKEDLRNLAVILYTNKRRIQIWFQNRRAKAKKEIESNQPPDGDHQPDMRQQLSGSSGNQFEKQFEPRPIFFNQSHHNYRHDTSLLDHLIHNDFTIPHNL